MFLLITGSLRLPTVIIHWKKFSQQEERTVGIMLIVSG